VAESVARDTTCSDGLLAFPGRPLDLRAARHLPARLAPDRQCSEQKCRYHQGENRSCRHSASRKDRILMMLEVRLFCKVSTYLGIVCLGAGQAGQLPLTFNDARRAVAPLAGARLGRRSARAFLAAFGFTNW